LLSQKELVSLKCKQFSGREPSSGSEGIHFRHANSITHLERRLKSAGERRVGLISSFWLVSSCDWLLEAPYTSREFNECLRACVHARACVCALARDVGRPVAPECRGAGPRAQVLAAFLHPSRSSLLGPETQGERLQGSTMKDADIKRLFYVHIFCIVSIILTTFIPSFFLEDFSVLETHLTWLCICSMCVAIINVVLYLQVKPNPSSKRSSIFHKVDAGNIFICCYFVNFYYITLSVFIRTKH
uniref:Phosphatidylinositol glycan anchor biosynthesis class F n=1 Tax=Monodelphis domestica TaxID=13616 RepID=A0A5F8GGK2_MONDO